MGSRRHLIVVAGVCLAACSSNRPDPAPAVSARSAPAAESCKPEAPVDVSLDARPVGNGRIELTVEATPTGAAPVLEVELILPDGTSRRSPSRSLAVWIADDGRPAQVAGVARVEVDGVVMSRAVDLAIGPAPPAPRTRSYALPDGEHAVEVRP
jgi:hypothetical protein